MSRNRQHSRKRQKHLMTAALLLCLAVLGFSVWLLFVPNHLNHVGETSGLQPVTKDAFQKLSDAAAQEGLDIYIGSDYRDYAYQVKIYNNYCNLYGWEQADSFSARPGYSEHQTGLTIDCNTIDDAFGDTQESVWLAQHCADYGFIIRFPKGKESITGYQYEPWHIRYVGVDVAKEIQKYGLTLEEYLGVDSVYAEPWQG